MDNSTVTINQKASLKLFFHDVFDFNKSKKRPVVIVCPGGGYGHLSDREGEAVALKMMTFGFHAAVLKYTLAPMNFPDALKDLCEAVKYIRKNAGHLNADPDKIVVAGFSAGAHLASSLGAFWNKEYCLSAIWNHSENAALLKPNALLLCYPVVTSGEFAHKGSIENVTGGDKSLEDLVSIEKQVDSTFPKTFIWHTNEDSAVPSENSLLLACALRKNKIDFEYHLFNRGNHGMSLATNETCADDGSTVAAESECSVWPELFNNWFSGIKWAEEE